MPSPNKHTASASIIFKKKQKLHFKIRVATIKDFETLYAIGLATPELQVSSTEPFMDKDEFFWRIKNPNGIFLAAETINTKRPIGFMYADIDDKNKPIKQKYAFVIYIAVLPEFRKHGIAQKLYDVCVEKIKEAGLNNICCWARNKRKSPI